MGDRPRVVKRSRADGFDIGLSLLEIRLCIHLLDPLKNPDNAVHDSFFVFVWFLERKMIIYPRYRTTKKIMTL